MWTPYKANDVTRWCKYLYFLIWCDAFKKAIFQIIKEA